VKRAIYPGSFDPVTNGHLDVVERARKLFDEVIVAVAHNDEKQPLFSLKERLNLLQQTVGKIDNVRIAQFDGLLVEFALQQKANAVLRGLRAVSDFEFEFQMALMNRKLEGNVETIFLMPKEEYTYLSSRLVKEIARIAQFDGLLVEFALQQKANAVLRGLRAVSDFEFEFQMALMNRKLEGNVETIFLMPKEEYTYLSSRLVKEIARLGGDVSKFVPSLVASALGKKFKG